MLNYGINAPHQNVHSFWGEGKWTSWTSGALCVVLSHTGMRFDGDVDAFRSMTVKITEIKTWNNSTSMFHDSMCGLLIYVFSNCWTIHMFMNVGCQPGTGKLPSGNMQCALNICTSFWKFPVGDLIFDAIHAVALKLQQCWWKNFSHICRSIVSSVSFCSLCWFDFIEFCVHKFLVRSETWD